MSYFDRHTVFRYRLPSIDRVFLALLAVVGPLTAIDAGQSWLSVNDPPGH